MNSASKATSKAESESSHSPVVPPDTDLAALRQRLVGLAVKLVWLRDDAEDIVQEAFKLAWGKKVRPSEPRFGPWMYRTVGNLCLNLRRRRRQEPLADWMDPPDASSPEEQAHRTEQLDRLRSAIQRLPEQQRLALVLRTMERMNYQQIADVMQLSRSAVRAHVHLARRRLAEWLGERLPGARP